MTHRDSDRFIDIENPANGQVIAKVGPTGGVSEPQLHFELRRAKNAVDPRECLGYFRRR